MKTSFVVSSILSVASATLGQTDLSFDDYLLQHSKNYDINEYASRKTLFDKTKTSVMQQNIEYEQGRSTWWATLNHLSDLTTQELSAMGAKHAPSRTTTQKSLNDDDGENTNLDSRDSVSVNTNPSSVTWIDVQSPVKNQGGCGSCWAFGTIEALESHLAIAENSTKPLVLAPQALVDCGKNPKHCGGTGGCGGSVAELGYNYTKYDGIPLETGYPYTGKDGTCEKYTSTVTCESYTKVVENSAKAMETALAEAGPVAVTVSANWATYGGGIFQDGCLSWLGSCTLDHGTFLEKIIRKGNYSSLTTDNDFFFFGLPNSFFFCLLFYCLSIF